ncbi:DUF1684 domain-containing protein [bacterium]|nr:DUF1684 domain-containing protein [bacterium]
MNDETSPGPPDEGITRATLALWDYRRTVADLYATVRTAPGADGWELWRTGRDRLFRDHPQSPIAPERRASFGGLDHWPYDPGYRVTASVVSTRDRGIALPHSAEGATPAHSFGDAVFSLGGTEQRLTLYWLEEYSGGVFLPFRDATNGAITYGGGRYLLDTAKGADLGVDGGRIVLDFNFAYHPSCAHDQRWSCPLSPPANHLGLRIEAGERLG